MLLCSLHFERTMRRMQDALTKLDIDKMENLKAQNVVFIIGSSTAK